MGESVQRRHGKVELPMYNRPQSEWRPRRPAVKEKCTDKDSPYKQVSNAVRGSYSIFPSDRHARGYAGM